MIRKNPFSHLSKEPNYIVCIKSATSQQVITEVSHKSGNPPPNNMNSILRQYFRIKKRVYYKNGMRPKLKDLIFKGNAIVCVRPKKEDSTYSINRYIYIEKEKYWSFFDSENDEVVNVWYLWEKLST